MSVLKSEFLQVISERGYIHQATDLEALDAKMSSQAVTGYIGFDCTADSLHVGSLTQIMLLRWLQKTGHRPLVLMGGGTTRIGDPSGKDEARKVLSDADIAQNMAGIQKVFSKFLTFGDQPDQACMVNNADWLATLNYIDMLRDYGPHFTINRMLTFDSVKLRLEREQPLTFLEFNYMILQAYDFAELARRQDCILQMGGSDQWGNIVNGVELARRVDGRDVFGVTSPLLTTASGAKMGKTAQGAIWLNEDRLSPYDYWQFWRNTEDADVGRFLRLFTELPLDEIAKLEALQGAEINDAKKVLANACTTMLHGPDATEAAAETAKRAFETGGALGASALPIIDIPTADLEKGIPAFDLLRRVSLCASGGEARKLIKNGGGKLNDTALAKDDQLITLEDRNEEGLIKLSAGKKRHVLVKPH